MLNQGYKPVEYVHESIWYPRIVVIYSFLADIRILEFTMDLLAKFVHQ